MCRSGMSFPCNRTPAGLICAAVKTDEKPCEILEGACAEPGVCPLSRVAAGTEVCIRQLAASPELRARLRELGLGEQRKIKVLSRQSNYICQVCNARFGLSEELARSIWVEPVGAGPKSS
jgi:Fe2+ transport system protein FeoA